MTCTHMSEDGERHMFEWPRTAEDQPRSIWSPFAPVCSNCGESIGAIIKARAERSTAAIETCDQGHKFAFLPDHPRRDGMKRCPHCMAIGLAATALAASVRRHHVLRSVTFDGPYPTICEITVPARKGKE